MHVGQLIDDALAKLDASSFTADRMDALYDRALPLVKRGEIVIGLARAPELIISDTPAQSLRHGHPGVGPLGGVPWDRAGTIVMPIGPRHVILLGTKAEYRDLDAEAVADLNAAQVVAADETLAWHPDADMRAFVLSMLDDIGRVPSKPI